MTAPTAATANCPSVSWPPRPVSTPIDNPTMAKPMMPVNVTDRLLVMNSGSTVSTVTKVTAISIGNARISQISRSRCGIGRRPWTAAQLPFSSSRPARCRCTSSATRMTAKSMTSTRPERG